jgi:Spy/CpxP family protein refolding chaperone
MTNAILTWLLAGALAASLAWNLKTLSRTDAPACGACASNPESCAAALDALDLTPEQRRALQDWSRRGCGGTEEVAATKASHELFTLLAAPDVDPERVRALATEVGRLRSASLRTCVDSVLEVRRVLSPVQTQRLLSTCCREQN